MYPFSETPTRNPVSTTADLSKPIDPQNPFDNLMENPAYRTDYRRILPEIVLPGYEIPLRPERGERKALRRCINIAGLGSLASCLLSQILYVICMFVILALMGVSFSAYFGGDTSGAVDYFENSSIAIGLNAIVFASLNVLIAWVGCRMMQTPIKSLFQTQKLTPVKAGRYVVTGISLQCVSGVIYTILSWLFSKTGVQLGDVDFSYTNSGKSTLMMILYACILAPVTEELLYRGFLMKTLSRVGTRFAIVISALMFGLMHGNISQMILAFVLGMYLGKIDVRHNSLLPSILVHMGVNSYATLFTLADAVASEQVRLLLSTFLGLMYYGLAIFGLILWFWKERKEPLPYPTQKQAFRSRLFWSSPVMLAAVVLEALLLIANEAAMMAQ